MPTAAEAGNDAAFEPPAAEGDGSGAAASARGLDSVALHRQAAHARGRGIAAALAAVWGACRRLAWEPLRAGVAHWRRERDLMRAAAALRGLDARTLRDIGITEGDTYSAAAEVHGLAQSTRERALRDLDRLSQ